MVTASRIVLVQTTALFLFPGKWRLIQGSARNGPGLSLALGQPHCTLYLRGAMSVTVGRVGKAVHFPFLPSPGTFKLEASRCAGKPYELLSSVMS